MKTCEFCGAQIIGAAEPEGKKPSYVHPVGPLGADLSTLGLRRPREAKQKGRLA